MCTGTCRFHSSARQKTKTRHTHTPNNMSTWRFHKAQLTPARRWHSTVSNVCALFGLGSSYRGQAISRFEAPAQKYHLVAHRRNSHRLHFSHLRIVFPIIRWLAAVSTPILPLVHYNYPVGANAEPLDDADPLDDAGGKHVVRFARKTHTLTSSGNSLDTTTLERELYTKKSRELELARIERTFDAVADSLVCEFWSTLYSMRIVTRF